MATEVKLKKLKENVETVEVNEILVAPGDEVAEDQPLLVVNADKSNMEVTAPVAGKVSQIRVQVGDELKIGDVYCVIEGNGGGGAPAKAPAKAPPARAPRAQEGDGTDTRGETVQAPPRTPPDGKPAPRAAAPAPVPPTATQEMADSGVVPASPATRWLARKLGVDLRQVHGTGPMGRITEEDVKATLSGPSIPVAAGVGLQVPPLPNFEEFGEVVREPLSRVRKLTAQKMHLAWSLIPHVTQHDLADITELESFRKAQEARGLKLTVTAFALKACAVALKQFPTFNSTLDLAGGQLVLKKYVHIGVAVDTKAGLLVPVLRDVDKKSVEQLAKELTELADKARAGRADMSGGTFTITNLGGIGGTAFTPIVNWPEVAILGLSRSRLQPTIKEGQVVPRLQLPLSLSYDHRVIDGADAARFTRRVAEMLENPWAMVLYA